MRAESVTPTQCAGALLWQDRGGPRGVASQSNGPLIDNSADRSEYKSRLWMFSPYDQMIMHYDDPERMKGYSGVFSRDYRCALLSMALSVALLLRRSGFRTANYQLLGSATDYLQI